MPGHNIQEKLSTGPLTIRDPGNAGAINAGRTGVCHLVSAAAETRTLANPHHAGLWLFLVMKTDGGDIVLTAANDITQVSGDNVVTFGDAGDYAELVSVQVGTEYRWRLCSDVTKGGVAIS